MDVGLEMVVMVKTNTIEFFKETIDKFTKYWTGGSYLVLRSKPMVPRGRLIIAIGYKYNMWKVVSFVVTENAWSKKLDIPYLYH